MFGITPHIFRHKSAAKLAAWAFEMEEKCSWVVVFKDVDGGQIYKPCRKKSLNVAKKSEYVNWFSLDQPEKIYKIKD